MFNLIDQHGEYALMVSGEKFVYTSRELARLGKTYLEGRVKDSPTRYKIIPA
jgi:hypothetical protein